MNKHQTVSAMRLMSRHGKTLPEMAVALDLTYANVNSIASRHIIRTRKPQGYRMEKAEIRQATYASGEEAAKRGMGDHMCPYDYDEVALRCHWMAGYHDAQRGGNP